MSPQSVPFTAACPVCGHDCEWREVAEPVPGTGRDTPRISVLCRRCDEVVNRTTLGGQQEAQWA